MSSPAPENDPAFPILTEAELSAATECGRLENYPPGAIIFNTGDMPLNCFVVVSGKLGIFDVSGTSERVLATHGPGSFTGDIGLLAGRAAVADGRAIEELEVIRLTGEELRRLMVKCPGIGEKWVPALLLRRERMLSYGFEGLHVYGPRDDAATLTVREFLHRNGVPHSWRDTGLPKVAQDLGTLCPTNQALPIIVQAYTAPLVAPTLSALARLTGVERPLSGSKFDVVIIGAGPAGLGAAVYAASEGLRTLVLDRLGPGGQAGSSSRIENYAGFPEGISGRDLAMRCYLQALKFGAEFAVPRSIKELSLGIDGGHELALEDGALLSARAVIVATGVSYRQMRVPGLEALAGAGVYYSATQVEAILCRDAPVHIIGAGNSAGQAAMYLSQFTDRVSLIVRGDRLHDSMSDYLADRVVANPRINVRIRHELREVHGQHGIERITLENTATRAIFDEASGGIFIFIGATPCTGFLDHRFLKDKFGFLFTGASVQSLGKWPMVDRSPLPLETSVPGILAAGDCRSSGTKRVAFAVGDGALAVTCVHELLGT